MTKKTCLFSFALMIAAITKAQQINGNETVNKLCGCFEVSFKYAETFSPDTAYKFHDREEITGTVELALPIEVSANKISIQHLLIVSDDIVVKHWREDWTYQSPTIWKFINTKTWQKENVTPEAVKGKWTQTVWEVSDEPRYQGYSQFVTIDGATLWQNTTDAPLPRREYTKRSDYNILKRTNRLIITDSGYIHEQDNKKILRENGVDKLLVEEKGINNYKKTTTNKCDAAKKYWQANNAFWLMVEDVWANYVKNNDKIKLKIKVDGKVLNEKLSRLLKDYDDKKITEADIKNRIEVEINKFIEI